MSFTINAAAANFHPYNCHMAVMHWALVDLGHTQQNAQEIVQRITRKYCPHCKGHAICPQGGSLQNHEYAKLFCGKAQALNIPPCAVGDVVIVPNPAWPSHSMVVVSVNGNNIGIRGYNNTGTFAGAPFLQYDPTTRQLANRNSPGLNPVFQIEQEEFLLKMRNLTRFASAGTW